jgi:hypothetical protein
MRTTFSLSLAIFGALQTAHAGVILSGSDVITGAGFGAAPRILTVQVTGNGSTESGCDAWSNMGLLVGPSACTNSANVGGDEPNPHGFPKDSAPTLSSLGFANASEIGIIFDATEPGNSSGNPLTMDSLILKFYSPTGTLLLSEALDNPPLVFNQTVVGNGKTDFLFVLDQMGINEVNSIIYSNSNAGNDHIALESTMSAVHGGPESFLAEGLTSTTNTSTPEPATYLLLGGGLLGVGVLRRNRGHKV